MHSKLDNSFCSNLIAILVKRTKNYGRNKKVLFNEVMLPAIAMVVGVLIANIRYTYRSPAETLSPDMYPEDQKILFNAEPIDKENSNLQIQQFMENLPGSGYFNPVETDGAEQEEFYAHGDVVYNFGLENCGVEPYQYGAYEIYQANNVTH